MSIKAIFIQLFRMLVAAMLVLLGFYLMLISTMGPAFTDLRGGEVDFWIRIGMLGLGIGIISAALAWWIWPLIKFIVNFIKAK